MVKPSAVPRAVALLSTTLLPTAAAAGAGAGAGGAGAGAAKRALPLAWQQGVRRGLGGSVGSGSVSSVGASRAYHRVAAANGGGGLGFVGGNKSSSSSSSMWGAAGGSSSNDHQPPGLRVPVSPGAQAGLRGAVEPPASATGPCITYWIGSTLYIGLTNRCNTVPLHVTRGPGFSMDGFSPLPPSFEPTDEEVFQAVQGALSAAHAVLGPRAWTEVCFAGWGEPTLRWEAVMTVGERLLKSAHGGSLKLRLNTNGLGSVAQQRPLAPEVASVFHGVTVALNTADPAQYDALMRPNLHMRGEALALQPMSVLSTSLGGGSGLGAGSAGLKHATASSNGGSSAACAALASAEASEALNLAAHFVADCVAHGVRTQVTAVARPDVDVEAVKQLALRLGADFRSRPFFP